MRGLFGGMAGLQAGRFMADKSRGAYVQGDDEEERRQPRGLIGGARNLFGNVGNYLQAERGGVSNLDRLAHVGAMMRDDPSFAIASQRRLDGLRAYDDERQERGAQQLQGFAAQKQAGYAERERLNALADSLGLQGQQRALFLMSPEEARNEFINSRMNPEAPDLPSSVREYEYARQQGFQGSFQDWQAANPRGTQFTVSTGDGPAQDGDILEVRGDSVLIRDSSQPNGFRLEPISGGDTAYDRAQEERQREGRQQSRERYGGVVLDSIERAEALLLDPENDFITGRAGQALAFINPESEAGTFESVLGDIQSNIGFDRLAVMRENSPTGGAVGQLSDPERRALQRTLGDLSNTRNPEVILRNLAQVRNAYLDALYGTPQAIRDAVARGDLGEDALQYAERVNPDQYARERMTGRAIADGQVPQGARAMVGPNGQRGYEVNGIIYDERGRIVGRGGR